MSQDASGSPKFDYASGANAAYIDTLYDQYLQDPSSVDVSWQKFFEGVEFAVASGGPTAARGGDVSSEEIRDGAKVEALINAYRRLGHLSSHLDPLRPTAPIDDVDLSPKAHGLDHVDGKRIFRPANLPEREMSFDQILNLLEDTYCRDIGADYREINDIDTVVWFQEKMESVRNKPSFSKKEKLRILQKLTQAEGFEQFLGRRYIGQKRFSLEGVDSLIPMMDVLISAAAQQGVEETCIGMSHRGRLNILANFMGKSYEAVLKEFEGGDSHSNDIDGDVKYHKGFASEVETEFGQKMRLYLSPNPSHLECVAPVVAGFTRCRQRLIGDDTKTKVMPVIMHGDAAMAGQGIVAETFNLADLDGYSSGGSIHIIVNNQVGFTTETYEHRSGRYSSAVSKMVNAPVLHVNADNPEAVAWVANLAVDFRQKFHKDIVIDLIGYRRHGHNEGDEPSFTQPLMYKAIAKQPTCLKTYIAQLVGEGSFTEDECKSITQEFKNRLQTAYESVHGVESPNLPAIEVPNSLQRGMTYNKVLRKEVNETIDTKVDEGDLKAIASNLTSVPKEFALHKKLTRLMENRSKMLDGEGCVDWGFGEMLALASIAKEDVFVRLTGQDAQRGTFTSRHSVLVDYETGERHNTLVTSSSAAGGIEVINSPLSEQGCLGFEFGYSVADLDSLVLWEAQFGDFANGAQIIIDQFISASEAKWKQTSNMVLLLPHGHEGQGPEHSSARPERFLSLCGNLNMNIVVPTTPAQHFHALRRQTKREFRKPLVVMTPKSLLRHPKCVSKVEDFTKKHFMEVIDDSEVKKKESIEKIIICSGKLYYEILAIRDENTEWTNAAVVRLEQLYPFPYDPLKEMMESYPKLKEIVWTQEEPQNMGGWHFVSRRFTDVLKSNQELVYQGRKSSGTPAEGSMSAHVSEQRRLITSALNYVSQTKTIKRAKA